MTVDTTPPVAAVGVNLPHYSHRCINVPFCSFLPERSCCLWHTRPIARFVYHDITYFMASGKSGSPVICARVIWRTDVDLTRPAIADQMSKIEPHTTLFAQVLQYWLLFVKHYPQIVLLSLITSGEYRKTRRCICTLCSPLPYTTQDNTPR